VRKGDPRDGFERFGGGLDLPGPSSRNPRYCSLCDIFIRENPGGAKVQLSMVFTDVRDSTRLAEELELEEYVGRMNRFYAETTAVFVETDGFMMDVVGDEVFALYPAGFSGTTENDDVGVGEGELIERRQHIAARKAVDAARRLIAKGRGGAGAFSFGIGVHTAEVFIGTVRGAEEGINDVRVWGPEVIKTARLSSVAEGGEALFTEAACVAAGLDLEIPDRRELRLKGIRDTVQVRVLACR
jgi:adenylate cyclase